MATTDVATLEHWIGGRPQAAGIRFHDVTESATGEVVARVPLADAATVDRAVQAAAAAAREWGAASLSQRTKVLFAFRELVHRHRDDLARLITREHGKVLSDALGEV